MVIWFNNKDARKMLIEKGSVVTLRKNRKTRGYTNAWYLEEGHKMNKHLIGCVNVIWVDECFDDSVEKNRLKEMLEKYVEHSGFENVDGWLNALISFYNSIPCWIQVFKVDLIKRGRMC